ncbi:MAG: zf-HC2 domain-containing protein, partial [Bacillota bacterium]
MRDQCDYPGEKLSAYIDGELDARELSEVQVHLDRCRSCRERVEQLHRTRAFLGSVPSYDLPPGFHQQLRMELLRKGRGSGRAARRGFGFIPAAVYLAALLAFLIILPASALYTYHMASPDMMLAEMAGSSRVQAEAEEAAETEAEAEAEADFSSAPEEPAEQSLITAPLSDLRTEEVCVQVSDVRSRAEYLIDNASAEGAQVTEQEFTWGPAGDLAQARLVFQLSDEEMSNIQKHLAQLGRITMHRVENHTDDLGEGVSVAAAEARDA